LPLENGIDALSDKRKTAHTILSALINLYIL
jgi:hypothetical protein